MVEKICLIFHLPLGIAKDIVNNNIILAKYLYLAVHPQAHYNFKTSHILTASSLHFCKDPFIGYQCHSARAQMMHTDLGC